MRTLNAKETSVIGGGITFAYGNGYGLVQHVTSQAVGQNLGTQLAIQRYADMLHLFYGR